MFRIKEPATRALRGLTAKHVALLLTVDGEQMSLSVSYMGTKRHLAAKVSELTSGCRPGPLLDLFSGMCSIGREVAPKRQVWSNDLQVFAYQVATAHFCDETCNLDKDFIGRIIAPFYKKHFAEAQIVFANEINEEKRMLLSRDIEGLEARFTGSIFNAHNINFSHTVVPEFSLFSSRFSGNYFGALQSAQIDSIHAALRFLQYSKRISSGQLRWALLALCQALSRTSTTTGHFAQPLRPKRSNASKFVAQRNRSVLNEWLQCLSDLRAYGTRNWRKRNKSFRSESIDLLDDLKCSKDKPVVVYADPPYTKDQYSRYYHILETAYMYDFPSCEGTGLYRNDRTTSSFSQVSKVEESIDSLIKGVRMLGADLILSYPSNGLLNASTRVIPAMIKTHYGHLPDIIEIEHHHSTMGASKGANKHKVQEILYKVAA